MTSAAATRTEMTWTDVCAFDALTPDRGVAALVAGVPVAIFRLSAGDALHVLSNIDPMSGAGIISRGIVGSRGEVPTVASPMYKQVFDLRTGACLDRPDQSLAVHPVEMRDGRIFVAITT